jgi:hypothetical protein
MQSRSKAKNEQTTLNKQITCHFACPWANADVSSEKSTKEIHASEKEKRNSNAPFAQTRKRFVPPSLPPPLMGEIAAGMFMLHRSIFQACSRKIQKQRSQPNKRRERCLQRGSSVTPRLVGRRISAVRRIKIARGRQGRFYFAPVRPVAVPGGDLGLTEPIFWYCRATLAFTQAMRR